MVTQRILVPSFRVRIPAFQQRPFGEIGIRAKLKILYQLVCRFDSGKGHKTDRADSRELKTMCYVKN